MEYALLKGNVLVDNHTYGIAKSINRTILSGYTLHVTVTGTSDIEITAEPEDAISIEETDDPALERLTIAAGSHVSIKNEGSETMSFQTETTGSVEYALYNTEAHSLFSSTSFGTLSNAPTVYTGYTEDLSNVGEESAVYLYPHIWKGNGMTIAEKETPALKHITLMAGANVKVTNAGRETLHMRKTSEEETEVQYAMYETDGGEIFNSSTYGTLGDTPNIYAGNTMTISNVGEENEVAYVFAYMFLENGGSVAISAEGALACYEVEAGDTLILKNTGSNTFYYQTRSKEDTRYNLERLKNDGPRMVSVTGGLFNTDWVGRQIISGEMNYVYVSEGEPLEVRVPKILLQNASVTQKEGKETGAVMLSCSIQKECAVPSGSDPELTPAGIADFSVSVRNTTQDIASVKNHLGTEGLYLDKSQVAAGDELEVTLQSRTTVSKTVQVTVGADLTASLEATVTEKPKVRITGWGEEGLGEVLVQLYDATGKRIMVESLNRHEEGIHVDEGTWKILLLKTKKLQGHIRDIALIEHLGLAENGRDHILADLEASEGTLYEYAGGALEQLDDLSGYLDAAGCLVDAKKDSLGNGEYSEIKVSYRFKDRVASNVESPALVVYPDAGLSVIEGSVVRPAGAAGAVTQESGIVTIPLSSSEGTVRFCVRANEDASDRRISVTARFTVAGNIYEQTLGEAEFLTDSLLKCSSHTAGDRIYVYGETDSRATVALYVNYAEVTQVTASKSGFWSAYLDLPKRIYPWYEIKAVAHPGEENELTVKRMVCKDPLAPVVTEYKVYFENHGGRNCLDLLSEGKKVVNCDPAYPFTYVIAFDNPEVVKSLAVVSSKGSEKKSIRAKQDPVTKKWIATGFFDQAKPDGYIPSNVHLEYYTGGKERIFNTEISEEDWAKFRQACKERGIRFEVDSPDENTITIKTTIPGEEGAEDCTCLLKIELLEDAPEAVGADSEPECYGTTVTVSGETFYFESMDDAAKFTCELHGWINSHPEEVFRNSQSYGGNSGIGNAEGLMEGARFCNELLDVARAAGCDIDVDCEAVMGYLLKNYDKDPQGTMDNICRYAAKQILKAGLDWRNLLSPEGQLAVDLGEKIKEYLDQKKQDKDDDPDPFKVKIKDDDDDKKDDYPHPAFDDDPSLLNYGQDPSGFAYEVTEENRLEGVTATIFHQDEDEQEVLWSAEDYEQTNPLVTGADGTYAWDVPEGKWRVKLEKEGYGTAYSDWLSVPPPQLGVNIPMVYEGASALSAVYLTSDGPELDFDHYIRLSGLSDHLKLFHEATEVPIVVMPVDEASYENNAVATRVLLRTEDDLTVGEEYRIKGDTGIVSYAGVPMSSGIDITREYQGEITGVDVAEDVHTPYLETQDFTVTGKLAFTGAVDPSSYTISITPDMFISATATEAHADAEGNFTIACHYEIPEASFLDIAVEGTSIKRRILVYPEDSGNEEEEKTAGDVLAEDIPEDGIEAIPENGIWIAGIKTLTYDGTSQKQGFRVYDGKKLLTAGKDYKVTYKNNKAAYVLSPGEEGFSKKKAPSLTVTMKGNYSGKQTVYYLIEPLSIEDTIAFETSLKKVNKKLKPVLFWNGTALSAKTSYTVQDTEGEFVLTGKGNFTGTRSVSKEAEGTAVPKAAMKKVKIDAIPSHTYRGSAYTVDEIAGLLEGHVKYKGKDLIHGTDYRITGVLNAKNAGKATVVLQGLNNAESPLNTRFVGERRIGFTIRGYALDSDDITVTGEDGAEEISAEYRKGGAAPGIIVKCGGTVLKKGRDYTVEYGNNKKPASADAPRKAPAIRIRGKGNYRGDRYLKFTITKSSFAEENGIRVQASDLTFTKASAYKTAVKVYDSNGKLLEKGKDYLKAIIYKKDGTVLDSKSRIAAGDVLTVEVTGKGYYTDDTITAEYRVLAPGTDIGKAAITIKMQKYTGREILITEQEQFSKAVIGKKKTALTLSTDDGATGDFEVVEGSYVKNVSKGTAKVTLRGINGYGGYKTVSFKIGSRSILGDIWYGLVGRLF
ncbi:MAG: hypothetical protein K6F53_03945 [Lachnospiraceae bacterium]|nr:hypothetical protein [Lachnospiraceae bacterium]